MSSVISFVLNFPLCVYLVLLSCSCQPILIWKWRLQGTDREYWRCGHFGNTKQVYVRFITQAFFCHHNVSRCFLLIDLKVVTHYNQLHDVDEKIPCNDFELSVAIEESSGKVPPPPPHNDSDES